jgi:hypothetical protein
MRLDGKRTGPLKRFTTEFNTIAMKTMTIHRLIFSVLLMSIPLISSAQIVKVSEGLTLKNDIAYDILGEMGNHVLLFRDYNFEYEVQAFDADMKLAWNKPIELPERRTQVMELAAFNSTFSVIYSYRNGYDFLIKMRTYDPAANEVDTALIKDFGEQLYPPNYRVILSPDQTKVLFYDFDKGKEIILLGYDLVRREVLFDLVLAPDDMLIQRDFHQLHFTDDGDLFAIFEKENRRFKLTDHHFEVYRLGPSTNGQIVFFEIPMPDKYSYASLFNYDPLNGYLVAGGLYSDDSPMWANGAYYLRVDPSNPLDLTLEYTAFDDNFSLTLMEKDYDKKNRGISDATIREIVFRRDGGILMIGERERVFERHLTGGQPAVAPMGGRYIIDFFLDDLFAISIHPDGEIHWKTVLHKKQYSQDDQAMYSSYFLMKTRTSLRLLYNDAIRKENIVSEYILQGNGQHDRNAVLSTDNQKIRLRIREALQISSDELIIPSERRNKLKLVRVTY